MAKFPEPPAPLAVAADVVVLPAGSLLWRVYAAGGAHPSTWQAFRAFGPTSSRFDHHDEPPAVQARAISYAAAAPPTCLAEYFQATRVIDRAAGAPWLVGFRTARAVRLLDLAGEWPTKAGASMAINTGIRARARRWSRAIYAAYPDVEGLRYASSMHANQPAYALYESARSAMPAAPAFHRALLDGALLGRLNAAAAALGYGLV
jgi:RES domain-containing protein